jgi:hypothetical protein
MVEIIVEIISRRAVADFEFRQALLNNPAETLADCDQTDSKRASLSTVDAAVFDASADDTEQALRTGSLYKEKSYE